MSFPVRKSNIERKIALKPWDRLKATYLHISHENTSNISKQGPNTCYTALRVVRLISIALERGRVPPFYITSFGFPHDRQMY